jgi:N-methylhydantoinase A/oxoprolinase/acetone carboxylase beta subunit
MHAEGYFDSGRMVAAVFIIRVGRGAPHGLLEREDVAAKGLDTIIHGTTLVSNALMERIGIKRALLTTEGFRDAVAIGTEHRYDMYDIFLEKPEPLVPRSPRYGVRERSLDDGSILRELDEDQVRSISAGPREHRSPLKATPPVGWPAEPCSGNV